MQQDILPLKKFLSALANIPISKLKDHEFCFQVFPDNKTLEQKVAYHRHSALADIYPILTQDNEQKGVGVFVVVNETDGTGRKKENIIRPRAFFVELDHGEIQPSDADGIIERFGCSIAIESSPGKYHLYWLLEDVEEFDMEEFPVVQQALATRFVKLNAGFESKDLSRVLRLPCFLHQKNPEAPFLVRLHFCDGTRRYSPAKVLELCEIKKENYIAAQTELGVGSPGMAKAKRLEKAIESGVLSKEMEYLGAGHGDRNDKMFFYAYSILFGIRKMSFDEAQAALLIVNKKNNPPLPEPEVLAIVKSAWDRFRSRDGKTYDEITEKALEELKPWREAASSEMTPPVTANFLSPEFKYDYSHPCMSSITSEKSLAERLIQRMGNRIARCPLTGWYAWNSRIWAHSKEAGERIIREAMDRIFMFLGNEEAIIHYFTNKKGELNTPALNGFINKVGSSSCTKSILSLLAYREEIITQAEDFNRAADQDWLALENGMFNMREGKLHESNPEIKLCEILPWNYDEKAKCPLWDNFVISSMGGDREKMRYLQQVTGYLISGNTDLQSLFIVFGRSGTGKTVYLEVIQKILGSYAAELLKGALLEAGPGATSSNAALSSVAMSANCRMLAVMETDSRDKWSTSTIKALTGGDRITAKPSHKDVIHFKPRFKLCIRANELPTMHQLDEGLWQRVKFIPFEVIFRETPQEIKGLANQLVEELPGIVNWAMSGYKDFCENGLVIPESIERFRDQKLHEIAPITEFVEEYTEPCETENGNTYKEIYMALEEYCKTSDIALRQSYQQSRTSLFTSLPGALEKACKVEGKFRRQMNRKLNAEGLEFLSARIKSGRSAGNVVSFSEYRDKYNN